MNLTQLSAFREVMLTGSLSAAARNLKKTQPAISASIASLERELGLELFERSSGRLHPVPEAHYLLTEASEILTRVDNSMRTLANMRDLQQGVIRIISMPGPSVFLLPNIVRRFVQDRDGIEVSLIARSSFQVFQLISVQQFDLGLADVLTDGVPDSPLIHQEPLQFCCVCAIPASDPLADRSVITAGDLDGRPLAALRREHPTNAQLRAIFEGAGAVFNQRFEMQYFIPMFNLIEHGLAYAIVDPMSAESYRIYRPRDPAVVFKPFKPAVYHRAALITPAHRPASNVAKEFIKVVRAELTEIQGASNGDRQRNDGKTVPT